MTKWVSRSKDTSGRSPDTIGGHETSILSTPMQAVAEAHALQMRRVAAWTFICSSNRLQLFQKLRGIIQQPGLAVASSPLQG
ncbi:hypothetical protein AOQ72_02705 [Bradyrhizobium yuanmingense]|uniref:Uncharacterized protein n=2 Tax=Bradyrhizobium yuanmingense TaxID=108015 RepID=A0A0R3BX30_9BRAD|nr:hypothetical protein AOQ72_02705 [Bradyrhizobium yuanmingense]